ncbi:hypothetical protein LZZ90_10590 [Flavobacterium sp. SM15]|uniref:hypothetical protein n=1 Tax=Flavobacterium sp. SM15 TaxID=2908005 RepID=UPI001EDA9B8C|nr:hypothetical protein [Flavobacterium sp. SM15]MCG2611954.1 hypothetical protein [Flavobacterium sp. SM15]
MKKFDLHNGEKIESGFKIPDNYFEDFEARLMEQLPEKEVNVISFWQRKSVWISSVAAVLVLSFATWMYLKNASENSLSTQEYLAYDADISTEDIAMHLSDEDITAVEKSLNLYQKESETYVNEY